MTIVAIGTMTIETAAAAMHMVVILPVVVTTVVATVIVATKVVAVMVMMVFVEIRRAVMKVATRIKAEDGVLLAAEIFLGRRPECSPLLHVLVASVRLLSMVFVQHKAGGMLMVIWTIVSWRRNMVSWNWMRHRNHVDVSARMRVRGMSRHGIRHRNHIVVNHMVDHMMRFVCMASITANAKLVAAERLLVAGPAQSPVPLACLAVERHLDVACLTDALVAAEGALGHRPAARLPHLAVELRVAAGAAGAALSLVVAAVLLLGIIPQRLRVI
mmetsp:Transcript_6924/g.16457  ORF Transcript_6924/g.16457 Transcript_6924/m.16457 type:complete len:272 (+) Transcript_6924:475-1290(+)